MMNKIIEFLIRDDVTVVLKYVLFAITIGILFYIFDIVRIYRSSLTEGVLIAHNIIEEDENNEDPNRGLEHFHNMDTYTKNFKIETNMWVYKNKSVYEKWKGKLVTIIPNKKIIGVDQYKNKGKQNQLLFNTNGSPWSDTYKNINGRIKWIKRRLTKGQITNYDGSFVIGNVLIKYENVNYIELDFRRRKEDIHVLTILFKDGTESIFNFTSGVFKRDILVPNNLNFIMNSYVIENK